MFDDDDFYAPHYIADMLSLMQKSGAEFVKLFGFFLYHRRHDVFAYWDLEKNVDVHYSVDPNGVVPIPYRPSGGDNRLGFGFSYVFRRRVWETARFPDEKNWNEDGEFANAAVARFKFDGMQDAKCSCLHVVHANNNSRSFPQHLLPRFLLPRLFPAFAT